MDGWTIERRRVIAVMTVVAALCWTAGVVRPTTSSAASGTGTPTAANVNAPDMPFGGFSGITPTRAFDSREPSQGPCVGSTPRTVALAGHFGIPASASAVALNVTAVWVCRGSG